MKRLLVATALVLLTWSVPAFAQGLVPQYAVGVNGIWFAEPNVYPSDFEFGGNASLSMSPHVSLVAAGYYGVSNSYVRASGGVRFTATDPADPNFSIGVGAQYHLSSEESIRPQETAFDASVGYRPWPTEQPRLVLVALGTYGLDSQQASVLAGVRYALGGTYK